MAPTTTRTDGRLRRALKLLIFVVIAMVVIALSIANRDPVTFSLDPFSDTDPAVSVTLPLYWLLFAAVAIGVLIGGLATWLRQSRWRKYARHEHHEVERMRREAAQQAPRLPAG